MCGGGGHLKNDFLPKKKRYFYHLSKDSLCKIQFEERNREHKRTEHNAILGYRTSSTRTNDIYSYANVSISTVDKITYL